MPKSDTEPIVSDEGIRVPIPGGYWILFGKEWSSRDLYRFTKTINNLDALRMVVEKALDWYLPNDKWEPWPFDKEKILAQIDAYQRGESDDICPYPIQLERHLVEAYYRAIRAARDLPLVTK